jgi:DNA-binding beta-propeller fold protein YncE
VADATQKTITAVSLNNGDRTPFSTAGLPINGGPILQKPTAIVVDEKHNRALVLDSVADAVFSVDLETGVREIIVNNVTDSFNKLYNPTDMDLHPAFNFLVLIDNSSDVLMAVDLETNQKVVLSH